MVCPSILIGSVFPGRELGHDCITKEKNSIILRRRIKYRSYIENSLIAKVIDITSSKDDHILGFMVSAVIACYSSTTRTEVGKPNGVI